MKHNIVIIFMIATLFAIATSCNNTAGNEGHDDHMKEDTMKVDHDNHMNENMPHEGDHDQMQSPNPGSVKSPRKSTMANIGSTHVHIDYAAPSMRGRQIFGGLVAYDEVWTPGAHKATTIEFYDDVMVEGKRVPKGKYGLFTIPGRDQWMVMINKNNDMHLADDYSESDDVVRFKVTPEKLQEPVEQLTFEIKPSEGSKGEIVLKWADVSIPFTVIATNQ